MRYEDHIDLMALLAAREVAPQALSLLMADNKDPSVRAKVYQNSGAKAQADALRSNYPGLAAIMGEEFFTGLAHAFCRQHPPQTRSLVGYGKELPLFIEAATDEHRLQWLGDVARLDSAWLGAHLAKDAEPLLADALHGKTEKQLMQMHLALLPSAKMVELKFSLYDLWEKVKKGDAINNRQNIPQQKQTILLWRPDGDVVTKPLDDFEAAFLRALNGGQNLQQASETAFAANKEGNLPNLLAASLAGGLFAKSPDKGNAK
jgi:putative DNA-binding protein